VVEEAVVRTGSSGGETEEEEERVEAREGEREVGSGRGGEAGAKWSYADSWICQARLSARYTSGEAGTAYLVPDPDRKPIIAHPLPLLRALDSPLRRNDLRFVLFLRFDDLLRLASGEVGGEDVGCRGARGDVTVFGER
jgi:hypothetical protein